MTTFPCGRASNCGHMAFRCLSPRDGPEPAHEALIRRMEGVLQRPLTPEEVRLILLAETLRDEVIDDNERVA